MLRVVTWNMNHAFRSLELRDRAWAYLAETVHPDIALLQEAVPKIGRVPSPVFRAGGISDTRFAPARKRGWGSAIVSYGPTVQEMDPFRGRFQKSFEPPLTLYGTFPGSVAVAKVAEHDIVMVSVYALITHGYADTTVHRILSDLTPLIDSRHGKRVVGEAQSVARILRASPPARSTRV